MHHSDRGSQYCSSAYRALQVSYGMKTSMSRKGNCWDNAPTESFFGTPKTESLHHYHFATREQVRQVVFGYIEVFYNRIRRHAKIGNQVPIDFANQQQFAASFKRLARPLNRTPLSPLCRGIRVQFGAEYANNNNSGIVSNMRTLLSAVLTA